MSIDPLAGGVRVFAWPFELDGLAGEILLAGQDYV
jgi:hypothetical protein